MNFIDIGVIIILCVFVLMGYVSGFIKMIFNLLGLIAAFFITRAVSFITEDLLKEYTILENTISNFLDERAEWVLEIIESGTDGVMEKILETMNLPSGMESIIEASYNNSLSEYNYSAIVETITDFAMKSLSFLITFLIVYLIIFIVFFIVNLFFKLPILNTANKLTGAALGAVQGLVIMFIVFALANPVLGAMPETTFGKAVLESQSSNIFYEDNPILNYLSEIGFYEETVE